MFISNQPLGGTGFLRSHLSVKVLHVFFRATRAMSKVMVKLRRYHSLEKEVRHVESE